MTTTPTGRTKTEKGLLNTWPLGASSLMGRTLDQNFQILEDFMVSGGGGEVPFSVDVNGVVVGPTQDDIDNDRVLRADNTWVSGGGGGSSLFNYVVDMNGTGTHTTIQGAIDAAETRDLPASILILGGEYVENVAISKGGIALHGLGGWGAGTTNIIGNMTFTPAIGGDQFSLQEIHLSGTLEIAGTAQCVPFIENVQITQGGGVSALVLSNTNSSSVLVATRMTCEETDDSAPALSRPAEGRVSLDCHDCDFSRNGSTGSASPAIDFTDGGGNVQIRNALILGSIDISGTTVGLQVTGAATRWATISAATPLIVTAGAGFQLLRGIFVEVAGGSNIPIVSPATGAVLVYSSVATSNCSINETMAVLQFPVDGVTLQAAGSATEFLSAAGTYSVPTVTGQQLAVDTTEVFSASDLPTPVSGVITLPTGRYVLKDGFTLSDRIEFATSSLIIIESETLSDNPLVYDGTGTFFSGFPARVTMRNVDVELTGVGSKLIDILGVDNTGVVIIDGMKATATGTTSPLGSFDFSGSVKIKDSSFDGFFGGFAFTDVDIAFDGSDVDFSTNGLPAGEALIQLRGSINNSMFSRLDLEGDGSEAIFYIAPTIEPDDAITITNISNPDGSEFFQTNQNGTYTSVADVSIAAEGIDSVQAATGEFAPFGISQFNFSGGPPEVYVGQTVTLANFVTNTNYNGTFIILETDGTTYFVIGAVFGTNEASVGDFSTETIEFTTAAPHGMTGTLAVALTNSSVSTYNENAEAFVSGASTFQIDHLPSGTATGDYSSDSLDFKNVGVFSISNVGEQDSQAIGSLTMSGNSTDTSIPSSTAFVPVEVGATDAVLTEANQRFVLSNPAEMELQYQGIQPITASLLVQMLITPSGSKTYGFRMVVNGSPLSPAIVFPYTGVGSASSSFSMTLGVPVVLQNGDTIAIEVQEDEASGEDILITDAIITVQ